LDLKKKLALAEFFFKREDGEKYKSLSQKNNPSVKCFRGLTFEAQK